MISTTPTGPRPIRVDAVSEFGSHFKVSSSNIDVAKTLLRRKTTHGSTKSSTRGHSVRFSGID